MQLDQITPMILTYNEEANLRRTLDGLTWAHQILLIDSYSCDATLAIAQEYPQVRVVQHPFDHFADQCNFGLQQVMTPWTLSLDADYVFPAQFSTELESLDGKKSGYQASFRYCVYGYPLRATLYPARTILYRTDKANYLRDGHAHRVVIDGAVGRLETRVDHDDRKPLSAWLSAQSRYASHEADKLLQAAQSDWKDRLRKSTVLAPFLTIVYCLLWKGLLRDGRPGLHYTWQRAYAELLLLLELTDRRLRSR